MLFVYIDPSFQNKFHQKLEKYKVSIQYITKDQLTPFLNFPTSRKIKWIFLLLPINKPFRLFINPKISVILSRYKKFRHSLIKQLIPPNYFKKKNTFWNNVWIFLHFQVGLVYPISPNPIDKLYFKRYFNHLGKTLPCPICRQHYLRLLKRYPIVNYLGNRSKLIQWLHLIHNQVNNRLNKPKFSAKLLWRYSNNYHFNIFLDNFKTRPNRVTPNDKKDDIYWDNLFTTIYKVLAETNLK